MTGTAIFRDTAWPDGSPIRSPRSRLRSASEGTWEAIEGGRLPSGLTNDESIWYAGWTRVGPRFGAEPILKNRFHPIAEKSVAERVQKAKLVQLRVRP